MTRSADLWRECAGTAAAALAHPFVRGLGDGSLPAAAFRHYVGQDAFFLQCFARGYALALARSPDLDALLAFAELVAGVREELRLHTAYAAGWGVDLTRVSPAPATLAYTDFLLATAAVEGTGVTCAAMAPCMRLYAHLGGSLDAASAGRYADWVTTYADPGFEALAGRLEALLDRHAPACDPERLREVYRRAMDLELAFFDEAFRSTPGA